MQEIQIDGIKSSGVHQNQEVELSMDIFEADNTLFLVIPLAGVNIEKIKIHLSQDVLTVSGQRDIPEDIARFHNKKYFVEECHWGKFSRSIVLPDEVESAHIRAHEDMGILRVIIPKAKKVSEKNIRVDQHRI